MIVRIFFILFVIMMVGSYALVAQPLVKTYTLDVQFYPNESRMSGVARIGFASTRGSDSLVFFLHGELRVDSVVAGTVSLEYSESQEFYRRSYSLTADRVATGSLSSSVDEITIWYGGAFHPSASRSPSDYMRIDSDGVFLRSYGYSLWFPVFLADDGEEYTVDFDQVKLTTPITLRTVFAGERLQDYESDGQRISVWQASQLDLFAAQCVARPYEIDSTGKVFLYYLNDPESKRMAATIKDRATTLIEKYGQSYRRTATARQYYILEMPEYGDISSGNVTGISGDAWKGFDKADWALRLLAHELVHPYVNAGTPQGDSLYAMAIEGFPSYFHLPVMAEILGEDWYDAHMNRVQKAYLKKKETGRHPRGWPLPDEKPIVEITADEVGQYKDMFVLADRVLLFFDWLRRQMGPDRFYDFAAEVCNSNRLTYTDFRNIVTSHLPSAEQDLGIWLTSNEYPTELRR